jgi:hypothetical protein
MVDQEARIRSIVRDELKKLALGELVGYSIGQCAGMLPMEQGMAVAAFWLVNVTMRNPEIGGRDISKQKLVLGSLPPDESFQIAVKEALEECRTVKGKILAGNTQ